MKSTFKERLGIAMELNNMKQVDLVDKTKIGKSAISQYVSGRNEPRQYGVYAIAKALNVNEAWLMGYDVPMERDKQPNEQCEQCKESLDKVEQDLIELYRSLDSAQKNKFTDAVSFFASMFTHPKSQTENKNSA